MSEWQKIETAPTDETRILACWLTSMTSDQAVVWFDDYEGCWLENGSKVNEPDFWMPLPDPPKAD